MPPLNARLKAPPPQDPLGYLHDLLSEVAGHALQAAYAPASVAECNRASARCLVDDIGFVRAIAAARRTCAAAGFGPGDAERTLEAAQLAGGKLMAWAGGETRPDLTADAFAGLSAVTDLGRLREWVRARTPTKKVTELAADEAARGAAKGKQGQKKPVRVAEANERAIRLLKSERTRFTRLSETAQAERIGCSWGTWSKTPLFKKLKTRKPDKGAKQAKDGGPRNVVNLSPKMLETAAADEPGPLERLIKEQAAELASDPNPLDDDPPDSYPRRVKNRKRL